MAGRDVTRCEPEAEGAGTRLAVPSLDLLPGHLEALRAGWSPNTMRPEAAQEAIDAIASDALAYVERLTDLEARGGPVTLPDGSQVPRLAGRSFWILDANAAFCGTINLRWQSGTPALPPHVLGHLGYSIVPWRRRRGHARAALRLLLPHARALSLPWVEVTTDSDNIASQRVIEANGGALVERFVPPPAFGPQPLLRYRIVLG